MSLNKSFLEDAAHAHTDGAVDTATHCECSDRSFAAAVIDPETKVKLVVETHLDDDVTAGVTVVAACPGQADVSVDLPIGDVAGVAQLLVDSMRAAASVAEEATAADLNATINTYRRERDELVKLVLQWQNRKDSDPRPDASAAVQDIMAQAQGCPGRLCSLGEEAAELEAQANLRAVAAGGLPGVRSAKPFDGLDDDASVRSHALNEAEEPGVTQIP